MRKRLKRDNTKPKLDPALDGASESPASHGGRTDLSFAVSGQRGSVQKHQPAADDEQLSFSAAPRAVQTLAHLLDKNGGYTLGLSTLKPEP